ncbi:MAG: hypothetical protein GY820_20100 [Gammaproteobacteria bacterium]|nr:hypothetical protein [Gammaproteobacteria bacterium]
MTTKSCINTDATTYPDGARREPRQVRAAPSCIKIVHLNAAQAQRGPHRAPPRHAATSV